MGAWQSEAVGCGIDTGCIYHTCHLQSVGSLHQTNDHMAGLPCPALLTRAAYTEIRRLRVIRVLMSLRVNNICQ